MNKSRKLIFFLLILGLGFSGIQADGKNILKLRIYQGVRNSGVEDQSKLDEYSLRKIADACILSEQEAGRERKSIIKIYNLKYAHSLYKLAMVLKSGDQMVTQKGMLFGKRKMNISIEHLKKRTDLFEVAILPLDRQKKPLLISEIIIPAGKTAVLGFEDSEFNVYFMAVSRVGDGAAGGNGPVKTVEYPRLTSRSAPQYPPDALAKNISGVVIFECHTDLKGKVNRIHVKEGPPELTEPARADVLKWRYSPWMINGRPEPVRMHLMIFYTIIENSTRSLDTSEKAISETLERYKPMMGKWETTYPVSKENGAILEIIIAEGKK